MIGLCKATSVKAREKKTLIKGIKAMRGRKVTC